MSLAGEDGYWKAENLALEHRVKNKKRLIFLSWNQKLNKAAVIADRKNLLTEKMFLEMHKNIHAELPVSAVHYPVLDNIGSFTCVQGG